MQRLGRVANLVVDISELPCFQQVERADWSKAIAWPFCVNLGRDTQNIHAVALARQHHADGLKASDQLHQFRGRHQPKAVR